MRGVIMTSRRKAKLREIRFSLGILLMDDKADPWKTGKNTHHSLLPAWVSLLFWKKGSLLVDTGHLWKRGNPSCRASRGFKAGIQFAMAAPIGTHGTLGVAGLCQHSLPSATEVDASSRSLLEINKREMLYTLMTFPQCLSKTKAAIKLLCRGWDCPQPNRGREILSPLYTLYQQPTGGNGVIIRSLCGMGPTGDRGQPG